MKPFQFLPKDPEIWRGHYERIPGDTTTFHCDINGKVFVRWDDLISVSCVNPLLLKYKVFGVSGIYK